jgi:hypothetical protein
LALAQESASALLSMDEAAIILAHLMRPFSFELKRNHPGAAHNLVASMKAFDVPALGRP